MSEEAQSFEQTLTAAVENQAMKTAWEKISKIEAAVFNLMQEFGWDPDISIKDVLHAASLPKHAAALGGTDPIASAFNRITDFEKKSATAALHANLLAMTKAKIK